MYLVNSITNVSLGRLMNTDMLGGFKKRHPEVVPLVEDVPILVCRVVERHDTDRNPKCLSIEKQGYLT